MAKSKKMSFLDSLNKSPADEDYCEKIAYELMKCVKGDLLVKARILLKGITVELKKKIVSQDFEGKTVLFVAAQQGQNQFVNFLLNECHAEIEQKGVYVVAEDQSKHTVTPLWCAAVANKLEVVKTLIAHNANVNACSDTLSTPVRSACYMTNIEVVKYLVANGADIKKPNCNGGTCLINSVQSVDLCRFLIDKGADVNAQDNSGNLALHYAIREGRMETVRLLLKHGSDPYTVNDFGDDAIQTASLRGYSDILEYLMDHVKPTLERKIEAYELICCNLIDERHDIHQAIGTWRKAMNLRYSDPQNVREKPVGVRNPAYNNQIEARTMAEIDEMATDPEAMYMQSLIVRERILGSAHKDVVFGLMYRGAVYADTHRYQRCVDLWKYAFHLRHKKHEALNHECLFTLQALSKLFWEIFDEYTAGFTSDLVQFNDIQEVFEMSILELSIARDNLVRPLLQHQMEEYDNIILLVLHLVNLLTKIPKSEVDTFKFKQSLHKLIKANIVNLAGKSFLHCAIDKDTSTVSEEFYSKFPSATVVEALLECGADPNVMDHDGNTPLHVATEIPKQNLNNVDEANADLEAIVNHLLSRGAHADVMNSSRVNAAKVLTGLLPDFRLVDHVTLKCIAARAVRDYKIPYSESDVPGSLISFLDIH